jgi:5-formyltetrahydrofolate cyclo-ligase
MPEYQKANTLSVYLSMPTGEISTAGIVRDAFRTNKQVFVPYLRRLPDAQMGSTSSIMDMVELSSIMEYESLARDKWGIPSVPDSSVSLAFPEKGFIQELKGMVILT